MKFFNLLQFGTQIVNSIHKLRTEIKENLQDKIKDKPAEVWSEGKVKYYSAYRGYGLVTTNSGAEKFFYTTDIVDGEVLFTGATVYFKSSKLYNEQRIKKIKLKNNN